MHGFSRCVYNDHQPAHLDWVRYDSRQHFEFSFLYMWPLLIFSLFLIDPKLNTCRKARKPHMKISIDGHVDFFHPIYPFKDGESIVTPTGTYYHTVRLSQFDVQISKIIRVGSGWSYARHTSTTQFSKLTGNTIKADDRVRAAESNMHTKFS